MGVRRERTLWKPAGEIESATIKIDLENVAPAISTPSKYVGASSVNSWKNLSKLRMVPHTF